MRKEMNMSERKEKKRRYNLRLEYIAQFNNWLALEPPMWMFWKWRKWKENRPVWNDEELLKSKRERDFYEAES